MKAPACCADKARVAAYAAGILGSFLVFAGLVWVMRHYTRPVPVNQTKVAERYKNLQELNAANADLLNNYAWQDQAKGFVRLPIARSMELTVQEWKDPAAARSNLIARIEKAAAPPPKAPEKPSEFE
ncbi:MAG: hypothetical protein HY674_10460 [Chloroflexi bacterium]|nr:hypothetical protein [Chloroflexota bacterium]